MKKSQLSATRTIEKLKDEAVKEGQLWKEHASKTIEELRQENMHLHKLHDLAQVNAVCTLDYDPYAGFGWLT